MQRSDGPRLLVISLHDVAPPFETAIRRQIAALNAAGASRLVLKVVPDWHGSHRADRSPSFGELLREQCGTGGQIVLHGLEHRRRGQLRGPVIDRLRATLFAGDATEFLTLSRAEALESIWRGLTILETMGLPGVSTFCAPGWLLAEDNRRALPAAGIDQVVDMFSLHNLRTGRRMRLPALGFMGAGPSQESGVAILNAMLRAGALPRARAVKVYLHPQHAGSRAEQRVLRLVARLVGEGWAPITYEDLSGAA